jgi:DNA-binding transcriptional MocR family regulator
MFCSLSPCLEKCKEIVRLARKFNVLVFCDDIYTLHYYNGVVHKRLFAYDDPSDPDYKKDHVVSNGSFSKIFCPSLRVGWIEAGPNVMRKCLEMSAFTLSCGSLNTFMSGIVTETLRSGKASEHMALVREDGAVSCIFNNRSLFF